MFKIRFSIVDIFGRKMTVKFSSILTYIAFRFFKMWCVVDELGNVTKLNEKTVSGRIIQYSPVR